MFHKFMLADIWILKFENILEFPLIWDQRKLMGHCVSEMAKKLGIFSWKMYCH